MTFPAWETPAEAKIRDLRAALQPFADFYFTWMVKAPDTEIIYQAGDSDHTESITVGDIRAARAALAAE